MDIELSDQEQWEQIKKWLLLHGPSMLLTAIIVFILSFGWQRWHRNQERALEHASIRYEELLSDLEQGDVEGANTQASYLIKRYPQTSYASLGSLLQTKIAIANNDLNLANTKLDWVIKNAKPASIKQVARLRKARILISLHQPQLALEVLKKIDDTGFIATIEAIKGDSYVALQQIPAARAAYTTALQNLSESQSIRPLIQMKLDNLTTSTTGTIS